MVKGRWWLGGNEWWLKVVGGGEWREIVEGVGSAVRSLELIQGDEMWLTRTDGGGRLKVGGRCWKLVDCSGGDWWQWLEDGGRRL